MSSQIIISGIGAVSSAGWGTESLIQALEQNRQPERTIVSRNRLNRMIETIASIVPKNSEAPPKSARLRRSSAISKLAAYSVIESIGEKRLEQILSKKIKTGVIFTLTNGCVNYSNRFFTEALTDPALASPILFPETVFNAPSSHLSTLIGSTAPNDTLIGDSSGFITGIDLAIEWLLRGDVDSCVVVAAEEIDWLSAEGLALYSRNYIPSEGAAAIYLEKAPADHPGVKLLRLPDPISFSGVSREQAAREIRAALAPTDDGQTLLVDGQTGVTRFDRPEIRAWSDWTGPRWSPRKLLGESMGASTALQVAAAAAAIRSGKFPRAIVSSIGGNQQAAGLLLGHSSK